MTSTSTRPISCTPKCPVGGGPAYLQLLRGVHDNFPARGGAVLQLAPEGAAPQLAVPVPVPLASQPPGRQPHGLPPVAAVPSVPEWWATGAEAAPALLARGDEAEPQPAGAARRAAPAARQSFPRSSSSRRAAAASARTASEHATLQSRADESCGAEREGERRRQKGPGLSLVAGQQLLNKEGGL
mmetsp:Transcript_29627/g.81511  ORF Transcript_29627/g.81511 Transcript_29627/m.81511 type:complete len:185 (-) Transcript_29627:256-810(-)